MKFDMNTNLHEQNDCFMNKNTIIIHWSDYPASPGSQ